METDQTSKARTIKGLDEFLERDQDRALFDMSPLPKPPASDRSGPS